MLVMRRLYRSKYMETLFLFSFTCLFSYKLNAKSNAKSNVRFLTVYLTLDLTGDLTGDLALFIMTSSFCILITSGAIGALLMMTSS